jgi:D-serine dehydratase
MIDIMQGLKDKESVWWENPNFLKITEFLTTLDINYENIIEAKDRLERFRPYLANKFNPSLSK